MDFLPSCFPFRLLQKEHRMCQLSRAHLSGSVFSPQEPESLSVCVCYQTAKELHMSAQNSALMCAPHPGKPSLLPCSGLSSVSFIKFHGTPCCLPRSRQMKQGALRVNAPSQDLHLDSSKMLITPWLLTLTSFGGGYLDSCWVYVVCDSFGNKR